MWLLEYLNFHMWFPLSYYWGVSASRLNQDITESNGTESESFSKYCSWRESRDNLPCLLYIHEKHKLLFYIF